MEVQVEKEVAGDPNIPFRNYRKRGTLELQDFDDRRELLRQLFFDYGPGKYALKHLYGSGINCVLITEIRDHPDAEFVHAEIYPDDYCLAKYGFIDDVEGLIQPWIVGHEEYPDSGYSF